MKSHPFIAWFERYLFRPKPIEYALALLFLPLSLLLGFWLFLRYFFARPEDLGLPVISIGNLLLGGSGKTPLTIALASECERAAVVLRGFGRASQGLYIISQWGSIKADIQTSGDEAMLLAQSLPKASVIVSEDRKEGIKKALELGARVVFLDDGYSKHTIKKFDIIVEPKEQHYLPLIFPSGPFKDILWPGKKVLRLKEGRDFTRKVVLENPSERMLLITAISKPWRLDGYLPEVVEKVYFPDHYSFKRSEIEALFEKYAASSIVTTQKDAVKLEGFGLPLSILSLSLIIDDKISTQIKHYIKSYDAKEN